MSNSKSIEVLPIYFDNVMETDYDVYILVGGRNSGKTHFMGQYTTMDLNNCEDYKLLIVEDVETNINEGVKTNLIERIDSFGWSEMFNSTKQPPRIEHLITGNSVLFKGYHSKKQQKRVKSLNGITAAWYEEAQNITYEQFKALQMQLRGGNPEDRKLFLTMNPINQDGFINNYFFKQKPDKVIKAFEDGRPKIFEKNIKVEVGDKEVITTCLVIVSTYKDNPHLTLQQIAAIEELKYTDPDMYKMLAEGKFVKKEGTLLKELNKFSLAKLDLSQADKITAIVDTASSGSDSATLGIYAKYDERHYLVEAYKDDRDANVVIPQMASLINKFNPQYVRVEENHEGLYYESELKNRTKHSIKVTKFRSTENKHEKILSQSGRMRTDLFVRDDIKRNSNYYDFLTQVLDYNKDPKENKHDDCIDNIAMYFKHGNKVSWGW